ncbi:MAG: ATP-binding protein [Nitrospinales bacterium]
MDIFPQKILLVEDDEDDVFFISELIADLVINPSPEIIHANSPSSCINFLLNDAFDICLFDYRLGEMDGIHLIQLVRSKGLNCPIILLTGQGDQEIAVQAMKAGAIDYLVKSKLTSESLETAMRYAMQLHNEEIRRKTTEQQLVKSNSEILKANNELQDSLEKLKHAQNQILRSDKLASIGRLAAGVCHEILNPINIISGQAQSLKMERPEDHVLIEDLNSILDEIGRVEKILSGLLKFSREEAIEIKEVDILENLNSVLAIIDKDLHNNEIKVVKIFSDGLPLINVDADRIRQVFLNIINNAKYAMNNGGTLTISTLKFTKNISKSRRKTDVIAQDNFENISSMPYFRIIFSDTGTGIKEEDISKLFDPFFTTKPEDKGTGLGLSVCHTIIEKHGGNIEIESKVGIGSSFIIDLPFHPPKFG